MPFGMPVEAAGRTDKNLISRQKVTSSSTHRRKVPAQDPSGIQSALLENEPVQDPLLSNTEFEKARNGFAVHRGTPGRTFLL